MVGIFMSGWYQMVFSRLQKSSPGLHRPAGREPHESRKDRSLLPPLSFEFTA
jgi:hypothetical protein